MILGIDTGNVESAYVVVKNDLSKVIMKGKVSNEHLESIVKNLRHFNCEWHVAIEMIASYGMAVGKTVFDTCVENGRLEVLAEQNLGVHPTRIYRKDEKMNLCYSMKAKDSNIRKALIDRFGVVGTKKNKGYFYGFKKDIWSAMAVAVTYHDLYMVRKDD